MLNVQNVELKQTVFYQEVWEEGKQEGLQTGLQKGLQKGLQQGEQILLQRMLTRRFGQLPDWVNNRLNQANAQQLEQWADDLLDAKNLEAIFKDSLN